MKKNKVLISFLAIMMFSFSLYARVYNFPTINYKNVILKYDDGLIFFKNRRFQDKDVLLFFFGSKCPHCKAEIPKIKELAQRNDLKIVACHAQAMIGDKALRNYIYRVDYNFDVLSFKRDINLINLMKKIGIWNGNVPFHVLVHKDGTFEVLKLSQILKLYKDKDRKYFESFTIKQPQSPLYAQ